jgi:hypothetical protein
MVCTLPWQCGGAKFASNEESLQVDFRLARKGFMKDFRGKWQVQPFTQHTLDDLYNAGRQNRQQQKPPWRSLTSALNNCEDLLLLISHAIRISDM